jgi:periplasmic protein CpxP/Spy
MKTSQKWTKRLATGAVMIALPLAAMAFGPAGDAPEGAPPMPQAGGPLALPERGMPHENFLPPLPPPFPGANPPFLRDLKLTETQQDKLFALAHEQAPLVRERTKASFKAMDELRGLAASNNFDANKARRLADAYGQATAQLALMHAEMEVKVRALLTAEQRQQLDDARAKAERRRNPKRP